MAKICNVRSNAINALVEKGVIAEDMKILDPKFFLLNQQYTNVAKKKYGVTAEDMIFSTKSKQSPKLEKMPYYRTDDTVTGDIYAVPNDAFFEDLQIKHDLYHSANAENNDKAYLNFVDTSKQQYDLALNPQINILDEDTKSSVMKSIGAVNTPIIEQEFIQVANRLKNFNTQNDTSYMLVASEMEDGKIKIDDLSQNTLSKNAPDEVVMGLINKMRNLFPEINFEFINPDQVANIVDGQYAVNTNTVNAFSKNGTVYLVLGRFTPI